MYCQISYFILITITKMHSIVIVIFMCAQLAPVVLANINRNGAFFHETVIVVLQIFVFLKQLAT
jgi:hypothetical protein